MAPPFVDQNLQENEGGSPYQVPMDDTEDAN